MSDDDDYVQDLRRQSRQAGNKQWGDKKLLRIEGLGPITPTKQIIQLDLDVPRVVRVRVVARQLSGVGSCAGSIVGLQIVSGVGNARIESQAALLPVPGAPAEFNLDTPATQVAVSFTFDTVASLPPYNLEIAVIAAPWGRD